MHCSHCGSLTDEGKFCANCGAPLSKDTYEDNAASQAASASESPQPDIPVQETQPGFGTFFSTLITSPSDAMKAGARDMIPGLSILGLFALLMAIDAYISLSMFHSTVKVNFGDHFLIPLIKAALLLILHAAAIFGAAKLSSARSLSLQAVIGKYGAYLVPFLLLYAVGIILILLDLEYLSSLATRTSMLGASYVIPALIVAQAARKDKNSMDVMYAILIMLAVAACLRGYYSDTLINVQSLFN